MSPTDFASFQRGMRQVRDWLLRAGQTAPSSLEAGLRRQAAHALQENEGVDIGPMSHAERNAYMTRFAQGMPAMPETGTGSAPKEGQPDPEGDAPLCGRCSQPYEWGQGSFMGYHGYMWSHTGCPPE